MIIHTFLKHVLCFTCLFLGIAHSAIITVDGTDGSVAVDGFCSISEAIEAANIDGAVNECSAGSGTDTLNLSTNIILDTVIENSTLGKSGTPNITSTIIIDGMGFSVIRDTELGCNLNGLPGSGEFRIITINDMGDLTLKNINLSNGCADGKGMEFNDDDKGGSILNEGQLSIENSTLSGNQAFTDGGAIYNDGAIISIQNSTLSGNSADAGGGIFNRSQISIIQNTTFSGNSASQGGVILNLFFISTLRNSLFHQNLTMNNDSECLSFGGSIGGINNLTDYSNSTCPGTSQTLTTSTVGPLTDNGGSILTHALLPGSEAIDAGNGDSTTTDQRGYTATNTRDIGAFESFVPVITAPADVLQFEATGVLTSPPLGSATASDVDEDELDLIITNSQSSDFPIGLTTVTWTVTDTYGFESTDTQLIEILNATPIANADAYSTNEDTVLNSVVSVLNNDNDPNNDMLTVVNTGVTKMIGMGGSINLSANGTFVYTPVTDISGTDELSYLVTDGTNTVAATITITVNPVNDAPTFKVMGDVDVTGLVDATIDFVEVPNFIENIVLGPTDESGQSIDSITTDAIDPDNVINAVSIDNNGLLRVDINIGNYGAAIIQVQLKDDGGTANGGQDTSSIVEFMVIYDDLVFKNGFEEILKTTL